MERRLARLEARVPRPAPSQTSTFDPKRLSLEEGYELDQLLSLLRPDEEPHPASDPYGLWALSDEELARCSALVRKGNGLPEPPAHPYRDHRSAPCSCAGCGAK